MLSGTAARFIVLVAPAGYGKTTIAQEWLRDKPHLWYRATPASADIASLVTDLAELFSVQTKGVAEQVRTRLALTPEPAADRQALGAILKTATGALAPGTLIAIDDYDALAASPEADDLVWDLLTGSDLKLLVTARSRPRWATARRILYGEVFEVGQTSLAMDPDEATRVLARRKGQRLPGLVALAQGWPAVLGLAALTDEPPPPGGLSNELYDFFAEELYQRVPSNLRPSLMKLAFVTTIDERTIENLVGRDATAITDVATQIGFLNVSRDGELSAHPLVQTFLEKKAVSAPERRTAVGREIAATLIASGYWDDAFRVIERFGLYPLLDDLISASLRDMVRTGRLTTLERWCALADTGRPIAAVDLAKAEIAFRRSAYQAAETLAVRASQGMPDDHLLAARVSLLAGNAAHLADNEERGFEHHSRARALARTDDERRQAVWGQLICANQLDLPVVTELIVELQRSSEGSPDHALRVATMKVIVGLRREGLIEALPALHGAYPLVQEAQDPLARTGYLNMFARCLALAGSYTDAMEVADELLSDAREHSLDFAIPHALVAKAMGEAGAKRFAAALRSLDEAEAVARSRNDAHNLVDARSLRCRILTSQARFAAALDATHHSPDGAAPGPRAEFLLSRALALVGDARTEEALTLRDVALAQSGQARRAHEVRSIATWIDAIIASQKGDATTIVQALATSVRTGIVDRFVTAYRGFPSILSVMVEDPAAGALALPILDRADDAALAEGVGLGRGASNGQVLTQRETEVYELLAAGHTNREIASSLFITEVTVKVHVRNIFRKLGVRSRTEAAVLAARQQPR
jgi:LuxR family maltose regulon positive regulatory protein